MRFIDKHHSNNAQDRFVYTFRMGTEELEIIYGLARKAIQYTPRTIESVPLLGRLRQIATVTGQALGKLPLPRKSIDPSKEQSTTTAKSLEEAQ